MDTNFELLGQSTNSTSFQLFVAGHCDSRYANPASLTEAFAKVCLGNIKVDIPNNKWKGFCFVYVFDKQDMEKLIAMEQINIKGSVLVIKPHKKGNKLEKMKQDFDERRIFVRIVSKMPINIDLERYFSKYGPIESAYKLDTTQKCQKGLYNVISYILFKDKLHASHLLRLKKFADANCEFLIKKVQDRQLKQKQEENTQTRLTPTQQLSIPLPSFAEERKNSGETYQGSQEKPCNWQHTIHYQSSTPDLSPNNGFGSWNSSQQIYQAPKLWQAEEPHRLYEPEEDFAPITEHFSLHEITPTSQEYFQQRDYLFNKICHNSSKIRGFWGSRISTADQLNIHNFFSS